LNIRDGRRNNPGTFKAEDTPFSLAPLRVLMKDGQPWFVAKDVCEALALIHPSSTIKTAGLRPDEFSRFNFGKGRPPLIVSESGFYKLVMKSRKPDARKFQDWVCGVVLPSLRKHGVAVTVPVAQAMASGGGCTEHPERHFQHPFDHEQQGN